MQAKPQEKRNGERQAFILCGIYYRQPSICRWLCIECQVRAQNAAGCRNVFFTLSSALRFVLAKSFGMPDAKRHPDVATTQGKWWQFSGTLQCALGVSSPMRIRCCVSCVSTARMWASITWRAQMRSDSKTKARIKRMHYWCLQHGRLIRLHMFHPGLNKYSPRKRFFLNQNHRSLVDKFIQVGVKTRL